MSTSTLSPEEAAELAACESRVTRHVDGWTTASAALATIRDKRLYRDQASTFADYVEKKWGMTARRAYQVIAAGVAQENVKSHFTLTEAQARTVSKLPAAEQLTALHQAGPDASVSELESIVSATRPPRRRRAGQRSRKPKPVILRGSGWRITIDRRRPELDPITLLAEASAQLQAATPDRARAA